MSNVPVFVGLDYHQDSIQLCVLDQQGRVLMNRSAHNDCDELGRLVAPLGVVRRVGIEACCGAADLGEELVERLGWNVLREQRVKIGKDRGSRWSKRWTASVRDNDRLSEQARWIVNDLLDDIVHGQGKIAASLRERGKPPCVIVGAVGNRWVRNLHHAMKENNGRCN